MKRIPFLRPYAPPVSGVVARLRRVWKREWFSNYGPEERELEARLVERFSGHPGSGAGSGHGGKVEVVLVANGTLACEVALRAVGIAGRPVYLPTFTFSATLHAVLNAGGIPRFVDCDPATWNLDPGALPARLEKNAVLFPVHVFGVPCPADALASIGRPILYDACEAFGAAWNGRDVALLGEASVFSLHATKLISGAEGGFIVTRRKTLATACRRLRNFGHLGDQKPRMVAHNAKLSELQAAMANESLSGIEATLERRARDWHAYREIIAGIPGIELQAVPEGARPNGQLLAVRVTRAFGISRDLLLGRLGRRGLECRPYFNPPAHLYPLWKGRWRGTCPRAEALSRSVLCLPFPRGMTRAEMARVAEALMELRPRAPKVSARANGRGRSPKR